MMHQLESAEALHGVAKEIVMRTEENPNSFYFIDYDDIQDNGDDAYHVLFGVSDDIEFAEYVASFGSDEDALEYIDWKNMNLPEVYEENKLEPDEGEAEIDSTWNA